MNSHPELAGSRLAVIRAHPGHELRLFRWLEVARPLIELMTDGSGGAAESRVHFSEALVAQTKARPGRLFGGFADRTVYRWMMDRDFDAVDGLVAALADDLQCEGIDTVLCDGYEGYNSSHDLAHAVAVAAARRLSGGIRVYEFPLVGAPRPVAGSVTITLSADDFARKMAAAGAYEPLAHEIEAALERDGAEEYRREVLIPVEGIDLDHFSTVRPFYETYGEKQVAAGRYRDVIRYDEHLRPLFEHLAVEVPSAV